MLKISLLGEFCVQADGRRVDRWPRKDVRQLLKLLALHPGHRLTKGAAIEALWPEAGTQDRLAARLHNALYGLRKTLEPDRAGRGASLYVTADADAIALAADGSVWVDVDAFEQSVDVGLVDETASDRLEEAVALYRGPLLPEDAAEDWCGIARTHLEQRYVGALRTLAARSERRGEAAGAVVSLQRLLKNIPSDEAAHRALMSLYLALGRPRDAERQYELCREALASELGVAPSDETRALLAQARGDDGTAAAEPPPAPVPASSALFVPPASLPTLIGRRQEMREVAELLVSGQARLVTLRGAGGVGKTQLAIWVANEVARHFEHGAAFVNLADVSDPELVAGAIGRSLGLKDKAGNVSWEAALAAFLADKHLLLVVDNLEQVLDAAPQLNTLLAAAPRLSLLCTSRAALNVAGEHPYTVPMLALPEQTAFAPAALAQVPAVALFVQRAQSVDPAFHLDESNAGAVAALCQRLDGLPLAIELAAARIRLFGPADLLQRLSQSFDLLSHGRRDSPERHRSLAAVLEWGYQLLPAPVQRLFDWFSLFAGGVTLTAAEGVCADLCPSLPDAFEMLLDQHLLVPAGTPERRYRMLETVRAFALDKLSQRDDASQAYRRFAAYWAEEAERLEADRETDAMAQAFASFDAEHANFSLALSWALMHDALLAQRLIAALAAFWMRRGYGTEGYRWISLAGRTEDAPAELQVRLNLRASELIAHLGRPMDAVPYAQNALQAAERLGDARRAADALRMLSIVYGRLADFPQAIDAAQRSLVFADRAGDHSGMAATLNNLGFFFRHQGRYREATECFEKGLRHFRQVGMRAAASTLYNLSLLARLRGSFDEAYGLCAEAVANARDSHDLRQVGCALVDEAELRLLSKREEEGERALEEAADINLRVRDRYLAGCILQQAGASRVLKGQAADARRLLEESLAVHREARVEDQTDITLLWLIRACLAEGLVRPARDYFEQVLKPGQSIRHYLRSSYLDEGANLLIAQDRSAEAVELIRAAMQFRQRHDMRRSPAEEAWYAARDAQFGHALLPASGPDELEPVERLRRTLEGLASPS
jgi:predicted ATPase/DNA-binding SARP family transcriptional activator